MERLVVVMPWESRNGAGGCDYNRTMEGILVLMFLCLDCDGGFMNTYIQNCMEVNTHINQDR